MNKLLINITDELRTVIDTIAAAQGESVAATIERILRANSEIDQTREQLKITWTDRTGTGWKPGRPRKSTAKKAPTKKRPT